MVGDSLSDIKAAKSAAFQLYCVSYGYRQGLDFDTLPAALKPDGIVKSLLDLPFVY